ncbi:hypothetical protein BMS3Abin03_01394 [bacterium BMS3Abin03]|nr:hypothetical protein BMS3Abin03_01394 [bacterium BMS3Abin03]
MNPRKINIVDNDKLRIVWDDDHKSLITLKYLRDECPCAGCKGETVLLKTYRPPTPPVITPGMYKIKNIETVGDYAIQITWQDGHNTGIYSWDYLKELEKGQNENENQKYDPLL